MSPETCGGCRGLGAHSPRCMTQPGAMWRRLADQAESLGDSIGPNDMEAANTAWALAGRFQQKMREERWPPLLRNHTSWCPRCEGLEGFHHDQCLTCYEKVRTGRAVPA